MATELRRSSRYSDFLPVTIFVDSDTRQNIAGPLSGRIVDISPHGACLLMTQVMVESFHIFHSTYENSSSFIKVNIQNLEDSDEMSISARPVWYDSMKMHDMKVYKLGVDFISKLEKSDMAKINQLSKNK